MPRQKQKRKPVRYPAASVTRRGYEKVYESDSTYFLKLVVFVLLGMFWLRFQQPVEWLGVPLSAVPVGMLVGMLLVSKYEKLQADRKIWYVVLLVVAIASLFSPTGIIL